MQSLDLRPIWPLLQRVHEAPRRGEGPIDSDFSVLSKRKRVFHVISEIAHRVLDLAVTEKDLDGAKVAGRPVDDRRLSSAKGARAILAAHQTYPTGHSNLIKLFGQGRQHSRPSMSQI